MRRPSPSEQNFITEARRNYCFGFKSLIEEPLSNETADDQDSVEEPHSIDVENYETDN